MAEFSCLLDLKTYGLEDVEDIWVQRLHVPQMGSNIFIDKSQVDVGTGNEEGAYS